MGTLQAGGRLVDAVTHAPREQGLIFAQNALSPDPPGQFMLRPRIAMRAYPCIVNLVPIHVWVLNVSNGFQPSPAFWALTFLAPSPKDTRYDNKYRDSRATSTGYQQPWGNGAGQSDGQCCPITGEKRERQENHKDPTKSPESLHICLPTIKYQKQQVRPLTAPRSTTKTHTTL